MRLLRSRKWRAALITLALLAATVAVPAWRYWGRITRYIAYQHQQEQYRKGDDPLLRKLAAGEYGPGYPVEDLIHSNPPLQVYRHDEFVTATFGKPGVIGGPWLIAKDGKLVYARDGGCSHALVFFNVMTGAESLRYEQSFSAVVDQMIERRHAPAHAVAGTAGVAFNMGYSAAPENP